MASNHIEDAELLVEAILDLKERTDLDTFYTNGNYGNPDADQTLQDNQVEKIQTAICGRGPSTKKLKQADFEIKLAETRKPTQIPCPQELTVAVHPSSHIKGFYGSLRGGGLSDLSFPPEMSNSKRSTRSAMAFAH